MNIPYNFIERITVSELQYPLYDNVEFPAKCYFALGPFVIWERSAEPIACFPAALNQYTTLAILVSNKVKEDLGSPPGPYTLTASLGDQIIIKAGLKDEMDRVFDYLDFEHFEVYGRPECLPWAFRGQFEWTLFAGSDQPQCHCYTEVEIYVLPLYLHPLIVGQDHTIIGSIRDIVGASSPSRILA